MRALTLQQPWAYAVTHLGKRVENRSWQPSDSALGEDIALHAARKVDVGAIKGMKHAGLWRDPAVDPADPFAEPYPRSAIVAVVRIAAWTETDGISITVEGDDVDEREILDSPWYTGEVGILFRNVRVLREPVPCKGALGLWTVPADVEARVREKESR